MAWAPSHHAPRDRKVWLFLPSSRFKADAQGKPTDVSHEVVLAQWDGKQRGWIMDNNRHVYPSLWHDAPIEGEAPGMPELDR